MTHGTWIRTIALVALALPSLLLAQELKNPTSFSSISDFIQGVLRAIVMVALPIITLFMVYAGFLYVKARGEGAELTKAHENFKYVIIGTILILGAWVLATLIGGTVSQILG